MQVVYLDSLFVLNALMDYLLLLAAARVAGEPLIRSRMLMGGILGGGYAAAAVLPGMGGLSHPVCKIGAAVLMVLVGLGKSRRLLRQTVIFFFLAFALGGGVLAISALGGRGAGTPGTVIGYGVDLKTVLLSAAGCYVLFTAILRGAGRRNQLSGELVTAEIGIGERQINFTALRDTGNTLSDPVSGRSVLVADWDAVNALFPKGAGPAREELFDPARALARLNDGAMRGRFGLLPYRAVGVESGLLLTVRPDRVCIGGREQGKIRVALSPTPVSPTGGWRGLAGDIT